MTSIDNEFESNERLISDQDVSNFGAPELSDEDLAEHTAGMVARVLESTRLFGVVEVHAGVGQVHVLGRVKREKERVFIDKVVAPSLRIMEDENNDISGFIGKQFLLRDDSVKYAWVFSFASSKLQESANEICGVFELTVPRREVTESPLVGTGTPQAGGPPGPKGSGRKGAISIL